MNPDPQKTVREVATILAPLSQRQASRRRFLRAALWTSAAAGAVVATGFSLLRRSPYDAAPAPEGLLNLTPQHYRLFQQLAVALLPTTGTTLTAQVHIPVARNVDVILGVLDADIRKQLAMGLSLFDNAAVFSHGRRFVDLTPAQAQAYVDAWVNADGLARRSIGLVVSKLTHTGYWMDARTWPALEFDGPVTKKWGIAARGNQPLPV